MPGKDKQGDGAASDRIIAGLMAEASITPEGFERAAKFVSTKFDGAYRPVSLKTDIESSIDGDSVRLKFTLPPGHYATTVCREFMKADPVRMI